MKERKIKSFIPIIMAFIISVTSIIVPSVSRYVGEVGAPFEGSQDINYTVNSVFEVKTQEELFAAINQGYSYIQISKDVENPLIVTQKAETLDSDLILDLNGIEIQRNGSDPILNIGPGVRLTVTDTSEEQSGGLYNPIGSVFNITGGTLTIVTGNFESGPRYSEYYSYNTLIVADNNFIRRTIVLDQLKDVNYYVKGSSTPTQKKAPIIKSYPTAYGELTYTHGNLYFDVGVDLDPYSTSDISISADTYCYYRTNESNLSDAKVDAATADWYYTYYVDSEYNYVDTPNSESILITIYGYENTIADAASKSVVTDPEGNKTDERFAAIKMNAGELQVNDGDFFSYFGIDTTACVNASGGKISIREGNFSSRVPNASKDVVYNNQMGKENDLAAFETEYFDVFIWNDTGHTDVAKLNGGRAKKGESYCILNSGNATVSIGKGNFYSSNNNIISMLGGALDIGGGSFAKQITSANPLTSFNTTGAAIYMADGSLSIKNATSNITGNWSRAIHMLSGKMSISSSSYNVVGDYTYGIYSTVAGDGNFLVSDTSFELRHGTVDPVGRVVGIYAENGKVTLSSSSADTINIQGANSTAIYVNGGQVETNGYTYSVTGDNSAGIYAMGGTVDVKGGNISLYNQQCIGIYSSGGTITVDEASLYLGAAQSKGIHSEGGSVSLSGSNITLASNDDCYGVFASSANNDSQLAVTINKAVLSVGYDEDGSATVPTSGIASCGVFLGSTKPADSELKDTVTLTGTSIYSYEVGVSLAGGSLLFDGTGEIKTNKASAIAVFGGNLNFSSASNYSIVSHNTTANAVNNSYDITLLNRELQAIAYPNTDGIYVEGGSFKAEGTLGIEHTGLQNETNISNYNYTSLVVTSYAIRVLGGNVELLPSDAHNATINIEALAGGGVYCNGGNLTLGVENSTRNSDLNIIKVTTSGQGVYGTYHGTASSGGQNWTVPKSLTGGHAVELQGGSITIHTGTYSASFGNGIRVKSPKRTDEQINNNEAYPSITVNGGSFYGNMGTSNSTAYSGPASNYGLKVQGGADVIIKGGTFDGRGGGAMFTGISEFTSSSKYAGDYARIYIKAGTFGSASATDGIMIFEKALIAFGSGGSDFAAKDKININSRLCPISANKITSSTSTDDKSRVFVYYGTYFGNYNNEQGGWPLWNQSSFATINIYNTVGNATATPPVLDLMDSKRIDTQTDMTLSTSTTNDRAYTVYNGASNTYFDISVFKNYDNTITDTTVPGN